MAISTRQAVIFGAGLALGIAGAWLIFSDGAQTPARAPTSAPKAAAAPAQRPATAATAAAGGGSTGAACPERTTTALSDAKDGQFQLQADVSGKNEKDIAAFIVVGKEAAAAGRARDAEVAFLMSCRVAEQLKGAGSLPAADAKYQLAWHYANLSLHGGGGSNRPELLRRAERLYAESLEIYRTGYGPTHEKTRFASEGLAALRPPEAQANAQAAAQAPARAGAASPSAAPAAAPQVTPQVAARTPPPAPAPQVATRESPTAPAPQVATRGTPTPAAPQPPSPQVGSKTQATPPAPATARAQPKPAIPPTQGTAPTPPAPAAAARTAPVPPAPATARAPSPPAVAGREPDPAPSGRRAPAQATMGAAGQAQGSASVPIAAATSPLPRQAQGSATAGADTDSAVRPSFDCAKARSRAERIICSDAELSRQDRELGRLYARARDATPDPGSFRRRNEQEWRRRESTCDDRDCLLRWYAQRRGQLLEDLESSGAGARRL